MKNRTQWGFYKPILILFLAICCIVKVDAQRRALNHSNNGNEGSAPAQSPRSQATQAPSFNNQNSERQSRFSQREQSVQATPRQENQPPRNNSHWSNSNNQQNNVAPAKPVTNTPVKQQELQPSTTDKGILGTHSNYNPPPRTVPENNAENKPKKILGTNVNSHSASVSGQSNNINPGTNSSLVNNERRHHVYNAYNPSWQYSDLPRRNSRCQYVPSGYRNIYYGGYNYRYYNGIFYQPYYNDFLVVAPPFGIYIDVLPFGYRQISVRNHPYYYYYGSYYDYRNSYYYVVSPPIGAVVESLPEGYETIVINGETYYKADGAQYKPVLQENGEIWYEVIKSN